MPSPAALSGPLALLVIAATLPQLTGRLVRLVLGFGRREGAADRDADVRVAFRILDASQVLVAWLAGSRALGPELVSRSGGPASVAFGALLAFVAWGSLRLVRPASWRGRASASGSVGPGVLLGLALGAGLIGVWASLDRACSIAPGEVATVSASRARLRRLLDPWDPLGALSLAWRFLDADDLGNARASLERAEALGAPRDELLRLRMAVEATAGDCASAHAAFEAWLTEHTAHAFEEERLLHESLSLERMRPPAIYLARCGTPPAPPPASDPVRTSPDASR